MTSYTDEQVPHVVSTAPDRIFLQVADDDIYMDESFPEDESEVTWCAQSTLPCEVEYVRADLFASVEADRTRLQAEVNVVDVFMIDLRKRIDAMSPPETIKGLRREYWKAGAGAVIRAISEAIDSARAKKGDV